MTGDDGFPGRPAAVDAREEELTRAVVLRRLLGGSRDEAPRIGRFTVVRRLGEGAMGVVYLVYDEDLDRRVALKIIRSDSGLRPDHLRREAQALARLSHPNVVQVHEVGQHEGEVFIVMEYVPGKTLREWSRDPLRTVEEIVLGFVQAGRGLVAAHAVGLVHRDFKPDNAVVDEHGRVRVLDFGVALARSPAEAADEDLERTHSMEITAHRSTTRTGGGTPCYMAPEQLLGRSTDPRSDQFAFCVALWEMLCDERPFSGGTMTELYTEIRAGCLRAVPAGGKLPAWMLPLLAKGLAAEPSERHASLGELLDALERGTRPRRRRALMLGGFGVVVLAVAGGRVSARVARDPCPPPTHASSAIWDEDVRREVREALLAAAPLHGEPTVTRVETALDAWMAEWIEGHRDACEATHVRHEQSEALLDARMRCLHGRRGELAALVGMLREADAGIAERAIEAVEGLPLVSSCSDPTFVLAVDPLPDDPTLAAVVAAQLEELAQVQALRATGRFASAREAAERVVGIGDRIAYAPLVARAELQLGSALLDLGNVLEAEPRLRRAYTVSRSAQLSDVATEAASQLGYLLGRHTARRGEAKAWATVAEVEAQVIGNHRARAGALNTYGVAAAQDGERDEARLAFQTAIELVREDPPSLAWLNFRSNLSRVTRMDGHLEEAVAALIDVVADADELLGPEHPAIVGFIDALAEPAMILSRHEQMEPLLERALSIVTAIRGEEHPDTARILLQYGRCKLGLGELDEARILLERANAVASAASARGAQQPSPGLTALARVHALLGESDVAIEYLRRSVDESDRFSGPRSRSSAVVRGELADLLLDTQRHEEAMVLIEEATEIFEEALGPDHLDVSGAMLVRGKAYAAAGRLEDALEDLQRGLAIREGVLGSDSHKLADLLVALAEVHLQQGEPEPAVLAAERAHALLEGSPGLEPAFFADAQFVFAKALVAAGGDRERAIELATQAQEVLRAGPPGVQRRAPVVRAWLRRTQ
jgi:eukaryotic-like serine/threonine-protein kinase